MPDFRASPEQTAILEQFRQILGESEQLFKRCAQACVGSMPQSSSGSITLLMGWIEEVHKGLLIKVYVFVAEADQRWSAAEKRMAEVLFDFIWPCGDHRQNLREAAGRVFAVANGLKWENLFRPFNEYAVLRDRVPEVEAIISQMANLVAKVDGQVSSNEVQRLRELQEAVEQHLKRTPVPQAAANVPAKAPEKAAEKATAKIPANPSGPAASASSPAARTRMATQCQDLPPELQLAESHALADSPADRLAEELKALEELVGLDSVKAEVRTLVNFLRLQSQRVEAGLPTTKLNLHMVFAGNPGTGKTTVGRIIGRILGAMGILSQGQLIETDRSGLVAEYAGQTAVKANKKVDEALDGVLFVDEAYSLVAESDEDPYGHEAIQVLLKRMEDDRKRLVVILAGYTGPMDRLLRSNPGLMSRFNTKLVFADYSPTEMGRIFQVMCDEHHYRVTGPAQARLLVGFQKLFEQRDEQFGNARVVRNAFECAVRRLANRIANVQNVNAELLSTFLADDIRLEGLEAHEWDETALERWRFAILCPACGDSHVAPASFLGRRVKCLRCAHEFLAAWGIPKRRSET